MNLSIVVADPNALVSLALSESLSLLFLPNLPVIIPDMVWYEVIQNISKPGANEVDAWITNSSRQKVQIRETEIYAEYRLLRAVNPATKLKDRSGLAAVEVVHRELEGENVGVIHLQEHSRVEKNYMHRPPPNVTILSVSEYLVGLQNGQLMKSLQLILDRAGDGGEVNIFATD